MMTDEDMIKIAQGKDVISADEISRFAHVTKHENSFFNTKDGWILHRVVRGHHMVQIDKRYCALCAHNMEWCLRPQTSAMCFMLCTISRSEEKALSWMACKRWAETSFVSATITPHRKQRAKKTEKKDSRKWRRRGTTRWARKRERIKIERRIERQGRRKRIRRS